MKFILNDGKEEHSLEVQPGATVIGRSGSCDVNLNSQRVSRRHVECIREGEQVRVRDLGSANGTYINGIRMTQPVILNDGDKMAIGDISLLFTTGSNTHAAPAAAAEPAPFADASEPAPFDAAPEQAGPSADEYGEDEPTPPDGTFMPEVIRPEGPPQPMVTQRDGRWFLRDPQTNREIEIVPKGQAAPTAEEKNKKLITYGVVGGAALLAILLIAPAMLTNNKPIPQQAGDISAKKQYTEMVDNAIKLFENKETPKAVALLKKANDDLPDLNIAGILKDIFEEYAKAGEYMENFNHDKVISLLDRAERQSRTPTTEALVNSLLIKVEQLQRDRSLLVKGQQLEKQGKLAEAYEALSRLHADGPVRAQHEDYIRELQDRCRLSLVDKGNRAMARRDWDAAIRHFNLALRYTPTENHKTEIAEKIDKCIRGKKDETVLAAALAKHEAGDYAGAILALDDIDKQGAYADDIARLIKKVKDAKDRDHVNLLYINGNAKDAIDYINLHNIQSMFLLRDKAGAVLSAFNQAKKHDDTQGHITEARDAYRKVVELEPDQKNYYCRLATERLEGIENDKAGRAQGLIRKAKLALDNDDIKTARMLANKAFEIDGRTGVDMLEWFDSKARKHYIEGIAEKAKKNMEKARTLFEKVLEYAESGSHYYKNARSQLDSLEE
ncbi:MAG: FHA domain-containing protein [Planctomycetes bacterium]|nr:FHA domain-containing protein [Planctomycetota bacterium]